MKSYNDKIKINFALDADLDRLVEFIKLKYMCPKHEAINIIVRLYSETIEGKELLALLEANETKPTQPTETTQVEEVPQP